MPRARVLISDLTGGEVSPRVLARADLQRYASSSKYSRNWVVTQQGGILLRRGLQHLGLSAASQVTPLPAVEMIPWTSSNDAEPDITFEIVGNTLRGWTTSGLITSGGSAYTVALPIANFASAPIQYAQQGRLLVLTNGRDAPLFVTVNGTTSWTVTSPPPTLFPKRNFNDSRSPPRQNAINDVTFVGFAAGNSYLVYVGGKVIKERVSRLTGLPIRGVQGILNSENAPRRFVYSAASTVTNEQRIKDAILESPLVENEADVTVAFQAGTTYRITMSGAAGGVEVSLVAAAESATLRIEQATNAAGRGGEEAAWSYPTVVTNLGVYYQCILAHVSTATAPAAAPTLWTPLPGPPAWEAVQPSAAWSATSISYGPGDRGFPRCALFHDQRLILARSRDCPRTIWGSQIGGPTNFVLGVEDDEAWSRDLDSFESPDIAWLASQQGLVVGTSRGIHVVDAEVSLTPTDGAVVAQSNDRCEPLMPAVVGDEIVFVARGRRQIRSMRWNRQSGPFETQEMSALAEHLARYRIARLVYAHTPQPVLYAHTEHPGMVLAVPYARATGLLAFCPLTLDGTVLAITVREDGDGSDELWAVINRGGYVSIERLPYPVTDAPVDSPSATATKHLDGWVVRSDTAGTVSGLNHLMGKTVTILNSAGAVQGSATVVDSGSIPPSTPVTISEPSFELAGTWTYTSASRTAGAARTGGFGANLAPPAVSYASGSVLSANVTVTPGKRYTVSNWYRRGNANAHSYAYPVIVYVYNGSGVLIATHSFAHVDAGDLLPVSFTAASVTFTAPPTAAYIRISSELISSGATNVMHVDDWLVLEGTAGDGVITASGSNLVIGVPFLGKAVLVEPVVGNPTGPSMGNPKRWSGVFARLFQSALPKINGERPSDYAQAGGAYRANPGALRSGDFKVNTQGWADGGLTIEQDLPHATQIVGLFGDLGVGVGE